MGQKYKAKIYKVIDADGNVDFRGTVKEIAAHYFLNTTGVYAAIAGRVHKMLFKFTLEEDGFTLIERQKYKYK